MRDTTRTVWRSTKKYTLALVVIVLAAFSSDALATSGTIDSMQKYAWSNIGGWVNFAATMSTVTVSDSALTGYVWSANNGWINLSPAGGGVLNDGSGTLSGDAWDGTSGWVSFVGVTIDDDGYFHGQATGENGYVINFDCSNCLVRTDWRANASTPTQSSSISGSKSHADVPETVSASSTEEDSLDIMPTSNSSYSTDGNATSVVSNQPIISTETPSTSTQTPEEYEALTTDSKPTSEHEEDIPNASFLILLFLPALMLIVGIIFFFIKYRLT